MTIVRFSCGVFVVSLAVTTVRARYTLSWRSRSQPCKPPSRSCACKSASASRRSLAVVVLRWLLAVVCVLMLWWCVVQLVAAEQAYKNEVDAGARAEEVFAAALRAKTDQFEQHYRMILVRACFGVRGVCCVETYVAWRLTLRAYHRRRCKCARVLIPIYASISSVDSSCRCRRVFYSAVCFDRMAADHSLSALCCLRCFQVLRNPYILWPCGHTLCKACIRVVRGVCV